MFTVHRTLAALATLASLFLTAHAQPLRNSKVNVNDAVNSTAKPKVIIVGAGLAGVSAARELVDAGCSDVMVLEARNRPGGRLHSAKTVAGSVDLGAMWIHEATPSNPLYNLAKDELNIDMSPIVQYGSGSVFDTEGKPVNMALYAATYLGYQTQLQANITRMRALEAAAQAGNSTDASGSLVTAPKDIPFSELYRHWVASNQGRWMPQQNCIANAIMNINVQNLLNGNVTRVSTLRYGDAKTLPAVDVHLKEGFDEVPKRLLPGLNILYNTVVTNISDSGDFVTVSTANGTKLAADYVIVTVPLGVLKQDSIGFEPPLPADKLTAIKEMGMGVLDKVVLVFKPEDVFWGKDVDFIINTFDDLSGKWSSWLSYYRLLNMPVLVALNAADTAMEVAQPTDEEAVAEAMAVLSRDYARSRPGGVLPTPIETHVTRWGKDPLSGGSYSYYATGNPKNITDVLAAPHGRVLFAGEATSHKMATALGALLSGRREAERLMNMTATAA